MKTVVKDLDTDGERFVFIFTEFTKRRAIKCYNESERFRHVFEQLHFKVDGLDYNWDAKEIEQNLTEKAKKVPLNSDAFTLSVDKTWIDDNRDTFIGYSCAQGYETLTQYGISRFGLSLTHMIAKYACEEPLTNIMTRTCNYMQTYFDESGCYAPATTQWIGVISSSFESIGASE
ncbi:unnamed protein product [Oppiella nova]|uniref:Uncharacterized protein n=1 Tax=Oppiella nova TaxID=334625 RepID=A0A7R9LWY5_9ACAR|nr:unnamed protein product [Oppiella nova]CAG2167463.1 unnamed protein product [Oppiella nova]